MCKYILFLSLFFQTLMAQTTFQKEFGGSGDDAGFAVKQTSDNGYMIVGIKDQAFPSSKIYIVKTNSLGDRSWDRTIAVGGSSRANTVAETVDGGFIIGAEAYNPASGDINVCLIKLDVSGSVVWSNFVPSGVVTKPYAIFATADKGCFMCGISYSKLYVLKADSAGAVTWSKTFNPAPGVVGDAVDMTQTSDGNYLIAASQNVSPLAPVLIKIDPSGTILWTTKLVSSLYGYMYSVDEAGDHGFIMAGFTDVSGFSKQCLLIKTDSLGNFQWAKHYGGAANEYGYCVSSTSDDGFFLTGMSESYGPGITNVLNVKVDSLGSILWAQAQGGGGTGNESGLHGEQCADGGYVATGCSDIGTVTRDYYLVKMDSMGNSGCNQMTVTCADGTVSFVNSPVTVSSSVDGVSTTLASYTLTTGDVQTNLCLTVGERSVPEENPVTVFPNPSSGIFSFTGLKNGNKIAIHSVTGQLVFQAVVEDEELAADLGDHPAGVYFYRIADERLTIKRGKIIMLK
jgi:hypothetical protein